MKQPQPVIVPDIMREVVAAVSDKMSEPESKGGIGKYVQFLHGHATEIEADLIQMSKAPAVKYPIIAVFHDFPVRRNLTGGYYGQVVFPSIIIATLTQPYFKAPKRYEDNFKPILYPIYQEFLRQCVKHSSKHQESNTIVALSPTDIEHTLTDRLYWGTKAMGEQGLTDCVDALELQNTALTLKQNC